MLKTFLWVLATRPALLGALHHATSAEPAHLDAEVLRNILTGLEWGGVGLLAGDPSWGNYKEQVKTWRPYKKTDMGRKWDEYQAALARDLGKASRKVQLKVLLVTAVSDSEREVLLMEDSAKLLAAAGSSSGDVFHWAMFHHDNTTEHWANSTMFTNRAGNGGNVVVYSHVGPGCKLQNWAKLPHELTKQYDYIWLLDSDMRFDFFRWDLYRAVLMQLNPLVSQPSILPPLGGGQSSAIKYLPIHSSCNDGFPVVMEMPRTEVQAPLLSTKIWPAVRNRINNGPGTSAWFTDAHWDSIAQMAKSSSCGQVGPLLVNAAPLWHQSWKTLAAGKQAKCPTYQGSEDNRREISTEESEDVRAALLGLGCHCQGTEMPEDFHEAFKDLFAEQAHEGERFCQPEHGMCRKWVDGAFQNRSEPKPCFSAGLEAARVALGKRGMLAANDTEHPLGGLQTGIYYALPGTTNKHTKIDSQKRWSSPSPPTCPKSWARFQR